MTVLLERISVRGHKWLNPEYFTLLIFILLLLLFAQCSKPAGTIGAVIQPENSKLKLKYTDTASIYAYSQAQDTIRTDHLITNMMGSYNDPVFGSTLAGFYMQFLLSIPKHDFGTNPQLDSLVIQLAYGGNNYGDTNTLFTAHVYEMLDTISNDTIYYSNKVIPVGSTDFANYSFVPNPVDSSVIEGDTIAPVLRFSLSEQSPELGNKLLNASSDDMAKNDAFLEYFKGLFITVEPVYQTGSLISFDLTSPDTKLIIFYRNDSIDSLRYNYVTTTTAARVNRFSHNFNNADLSFRQQVMNGDTALGKEKFYLQGAAGVRTIIKIPNMKGWREQGVLAINEAKLVLTGAEEEPLYGAPPQLVLYEIQEDGKNQFLEDQSFGDDYFGGVYMSSTNSYVFRITQYIQSLISDTTKIDYGLSLYVSKPWYNPQRFIFNGNDTTFQEKRLKLEILYTNLSQ